MATLSARRSILDLSVSSRKWLHMHAHFPRNAEGSKSPRAMQQLVESNAQELMPDPGTKPKVLVVDDEPVIADTLAMILNQSGFHARPVYSGEKALEVAFTFQPDMLISDVMMADLNGIDAAIRIRALLPSIKILLFSGQAATADLLDKAHAQGYDFEILVKPVHPQDLLSKLRTVN